MHEFTHQVILITGASSGIGKALAFALAPQSPKLVLAARDHVRLQEVALTCESLGASALVIPTDVTDPQACSVMIQEAVSKFSRIDALINNAGMSMWSTVEDVQDVTLFQHVMAVNFFGSVYCTKFALPFLKGTQGRIVAISSVASLTGVPSHSAYCASKHAMNGFFESLRIELAGTGVTVTIVAPDFVQSEIHERSVGANGQPFGRVLRGHSRFLTAERCADTIVKGMAQRKRLVFTSWRGQWGQWLKLMSPQCIDWMARRGVADADRQ
jgi:short-subunit dehydrogenase